MLLLGGMYTSLLHITMYSRSNVISNKEERLLLAKRSFRLPIQYTSLPPQESFFLRLWYPYITFFQYWQYLLVLVLVLIILILRAPRENPPPTERSLPPLEKTCTHPKVAPSSLRQPNQELVLFSSLSQLRTHRVPSYVQ